MNNKTVEQKKVLIPFFAQNLKGKALVIRTNIKAGAPEERRK